MSLRRSAAALLGAGALLAVPAPAARAQVVTTFSSRSAFSSAAGLGGIAPGAAQNFQAYCEPGTVTPGPVPAVCTTLPLTFTTIVGNGLDVTYTGASTGGFYFAQPGGTYATTGRLTPAPGSVVLTTTPGSNQQFRLTAGSGLDPAQLFAVGFDVYTNGGPLATSPYTAPLVQVYSTTNQLLGEFSVGLARNTVGFFGVQSSVAIGRIEYTAVDGAVTNTAIDNLDFGTVAAAAAPTATVPEPATLALAAAGLLALGAGARRRRTAA